jgi:hypothetical protein
LKVVGVFCAFFAVIDLADYDELKRRRSFLDQQFPFFEKGRSLKASVQNASWCFVLC